MRMPQPVITREKLDVFTRYGGDIEGWVLRRDPQEHAVMSDGDWSAIEELRHRLWLERHESVSDDFIAQTRRLISERVPDENTVSALRALI
jgi:hypothetical protein